jgi:hypothetical protein
MSTKMTVDLLTKKNTRTRQEGSSLFNELLDYDFIKRKTQMNKIITIGLEKQKNFDDFLNYLTQHHLFFHEPEILSRLEGIHKIYNACIKLGYKINIDLFSIPELTIKKEVKDESYWNKKLFSIKDT